MNSWKNTNTVFVSKLLLIKHQVINYVLRLSSHKLEIGAGRFSGAERDERLCKLYSQNLIESKYYFL